MLVLASLAEAKRQVEQGKLCIEAQRRLVTCLWKTGGDAAASEAALKDLEQTQAIYLADEGRILDALAKIPLSDDDAQP
jgi:hypothetical protein